MENDQEQVNLQKSQRTLSDVVYNSVLGRNVRRTRSLEFAAFNSATTLEIGKVETAISGLTTWSTGFG